MLLFMFMKGMPVPIGVVVPAATWPLLKLLFGVLEACRWSSLHGYRCVSLLCSSWTDDDVLMAGESIGAEGLTGACVSRCMGREP